MEHHDLKRKLVWQMSGEELVYLIQVEIQNQKLSQNSALSQNNKAQEQKYVYGLKGIAKLFGCSVSSAMRLKHSGKINDAIIQDGRKIIVDVEKALSLVKNVRMGRR
jgi:hypothetical protein